MPAELTGWGVIVTGGASGIGEAVCRRFFQEGSKVFFGDVNKDRAGRLEAELGREEAESVRFHACDVSRAESVAEFVTAAERFLPRVDVLVNAAGVVSRRPPESISLQDWDRTLEVNLRGTFLMCQAVVPLMQRTGGGAIVNFSSAAARLGGVATGADYVASKGGVAALTLHLAKRYAAAGIRVNAVSPGVIDTPMTTAAGPEVVRRYLELIPLGRIGRPEEVAEAVLFLASHRASYITGAVLEVTGGF